MHFHALFLDGCWAETGPDGALGFHPLPPPRTSEVQQLVEEVQRRVHRLLVRRGLLEPDGTEGVEAEEHDDEDGHRLMQLASVVGRVALGARAGKRPRCLRGPPRLKRSLPNRCAQSGWFNLHANVRIAPHDDAGRERLCRYLMRPPLSHDRLTRRDDGQLVVRFKRPWSDGTSALVLSGVELIQRLAALVLPPRFNRIRYHGVLAPAAAWRSRVVPEPPDEPRHPLKPHCTEERRYKHWIPWSDLLWRAFLADARACPECGDRMRVHAVVQGVWATRRVLDNLGLPSRAPLMLPARAPPVAA